MLTLRIPAPSGLLLVNLLGLAGLVGLAVAVGGLTGDWWWSVLAGSVEAVFLCVVGSVNAGQERVAGEPPGVRRVA